MISSNKSFSKKYSAYRDLYNEIRKIINFFEQGNQENFHLFGHGWNIPKITLMYPFLSMRIKKLNFKGTLKSYQGVCTEKKIALSDSTFNFCYENSDYPQYTTEKLFDAIVNQSVPIYFGEQSGKSIPEETHIDASKFSNIHQLYEYCISMPEHKRQSIVSAGVSFLHEKGRQFSHQTYAKKLAKCIDSILNGTERSIS